MLEGERDSIFIFNLVTNASFSLVAPWQTILLTEPICRLDYQPFWSPVSSSSQRTAGSLVRIACPWPLIRFLCQLPLRDNINIKINEPLLFSTKKNINLESTATNISKKELLFLPVLDTVVFINGNQIQSLPGYKWYLSTWLAIGYIPKTTLETKTRLDINRPQFHF